MRRWLAGLCVGLLLGWAVAALGQSGLERVRVLGTSHTQTILVDHSGYQTAWAFQSGTWNIAHISSTVHVTGIVTATVSQTAVNQSGPWVVTAAHQAGVWTVGHVSSALHIAGTVPVSLSRIAVDQSGSWIVTAAHVANTPSVGQSGVWAVIAHLLSGVPQSGTWTIQAAHQGGEWNIRHIGSVVHVQAAGPLPVSQSGGWSVYVSGAVDVRAAHVFQSGAWDIRAAHILSGVSQSGAWTVQATHQGGEWNVRHVSSQVHLAGLILANGATYFEVKQGPPGSIAPWPVQAHVSAGVPQSGAWTVQAAHQGGQWNIAHVGSVVHVQAAGSLPVAQSGNWALNVQHVSSVTHVAGTMQIAAKYGQVAFVSHFGALAVTCYTNAGVAESCAGSGGAADSVNVFHQSTVRHISSVTHVAGGVSVINRAGTYATFLNSTSLAVSNVAGQSGSWTIQATHQGGEWNVRHVSSVLHVVVMSQATGIGRTITYVSVNQGAAGTTVLAAAVGGLTHKILGAVLTMSAAGTLKFTDGVADLTGPMNVAATGGFVLPTSPIPYQQTGAANRALNLVTATGAARGVVIIVTEP